VRLRGVVAQAGPRWLPRVSWAPAVVFVAVAALVAAVPGFADTIGSKRSQVQRVLREIDRLDVGLGQAAEAYDAATLKLQHVREQLRANEAELTVARKDLATAERRLGARLRDIYMSGGGDSTLDVLLGANSLDQVINRVDTAGRVSDQDAQVVTQVRTFKREVVLRRAALQAARRTQQGVVAARAAEKARIERGITDRRRLVASIRGEIARLQAIEAARQVVLAAQARARLVQQRQEAQARINAVVVGVTSQAPPAPEVGESSAANGSNAANRSSLPEGSGASSTPSSAPSVPSSAPVTVAPPSRYGGGVVGVAMAQLGKPYVFGTAGPDTFDCSGLVVYAYAAVGISLPHSSYALWNYGVYVSRDQLQPGDLVFFNALGHVGIYIGGGQFIEAPHTGDVVKIANLNDGWYAATYVGARRIL
jgi:peptidoglycan DL-endopeptidase CwlO